MENTTESPKKWFQKKKVRFVLLGIAIPIVIGVIISIVLKGFWSDSSGLSSGDTTKLTWRELSKYDLKTKESPDSLKKLQGKVVRIPGFVVPLDDNNRTVSEFLLVPYAGACIHVPPPPPNQMVWVQMEKGKDLPFTWDALWIEGEFQIAETDSPYGSVAFRMKGKKAEIYESNN